MRSTIVILFLLGIIISGCIENPLKQVPVVKVNITFTEKDGKVAAENYTFTPGTVDYAARPRNTRAESFPAISGRTGLIKNTTEGIQALSQWEAIPFKGNGTYRLNLPLNEKFSPEPNDMVYVAIMVVDEKGKRLGFFAENIIWK